MLLKEKQKKEYNRSKRIEDLFLKIKNSFFPVDLNLKDFKIILAITLTRISLNILNDKELEILFQDLKNKYSFIDKKIFEILIDHLVKFELIKNNRITKQGSRIIEYLCLE